VNVKSVPLPDVAAMYFLLLADLLKMGMVGTSFFQVAQALGGLPEGLT